MCVRVAPFLCVSICCIYYPDSIALGQYYLPYLLHLQQQEQTAEMNAKEQAQRELEQAHAAEHQEAAQQVQQQRAADQLFDATSDDLPPLPRSYSRGGPAALSRAVSMSRAATWSERASALKRDNVGFTPFLGSDSDSGFIMTPSALMNLHLSVKSQREFSIGRGSVLQGSVMDKEEEEKQFKLDDQEE